MSELDVITQNLVELLTNSTNMTSVFYDVFLNPTPMDVTLQQYDSNNELITVTIPNRAKDRKIALEGEGSPEGVQIAPVGTAYVDTTTNYVYFKVSGDDANGWEVMLTADYLDDYVPPRALTADELTIARTINGVPFKGNTNITLPTVNLTGNQTVEGVKTFTETIQGTAERAVCDANGNDISASYTNSDLSSLTLYGEGRLHALKGYEDKGYILVDTEGLSDVTKYAHSTFDSSKFTVAGSFTIPSNGVISGFSASNYVTATLSSAITLDKIDIYGQFTTPSSITSTDSVLNIGGTSLGTLVAQVVVDSSYRIGIGCHNNTTWTGYYSANDTIEPETDYYYHLYYDSGFKLDILENGAWTEKIIADPTVSASYSTTTLSIAPSSFAGSIDLKRITVRLSNAVIFNGNQTGADTYTIGGSTITVPYTLSRTGSKIVDSNYRTEVSSVYEDMGYAPYYTLDEGAQNFTIPQGELYGYIEKIRQSIKPASPSRNIGEIVASTIPLVDAGLHLLDGSLILGGGIYSDFVDYIANLYEDNPTANYFSQPSIEYISETSVGTVISSGDYSGQPKTNAFDGNTSTGWGSSQLGSANIVGTAYIGRSDLTHPVKKVRMFQGYSATTTNYCTDLKFQYSDDGTTWIDIQAITDGADKTWQEWVLPDYVPTGDTHSFRVLANGGFSGANNNNWWVDELELYYQVNYTAEETWQKSVTNYGVCGKFVYDSENNTVRLPKVTGFVEGASGTATLGDLTEAGSPNITGEFSTPRQTNAGTANKANGAFEDKGLQGASNSCFYGTSATSYQVFEFDASNSNSIYGNSNTVQPQSVKVLYYIVVANSTKTEIQVDIDEVATDLNGKADTDLSNITNTSGFRKLIEIQSNGVAGYKIFREYDPSTGNYIGLWCEEWGETSSTSGQRSINFTNTFKDTNYRASFCWGVQSTFVTTNVVVQNMSLINATEHGFTVATGVTIPLRWSVCGYLA